MCMASRLVFVEVKIAVVKLLSRFRFIRTDRTPEHVCQSHKHLSSMA